jgi:superfamily I DNA/RNA helicase
LLTCFNIPLAQYLHERTLDIENLDCYNFHGLCEKLALEIGINLKKRIDRANKEERSKIYDEYPDVLSQTLLTKPELKYDAIIIDEGQDFKEEWWVALNYCQKDDTILYVFYDDNQQLYKGRGYIPEDLPVFPLTRNLRNAHRIHQTFSKYYKSNQKTVCEGPTGGKVEMVKYQNVSELAKQLGKVLYTLVEEERIDAREIAVLTPKGQTVLRDIELTNGFKLITVDDLPKNPKRDITWSTVYRFKGLERSVVIVVELDQDLLAKGVEWIQLCYVAFSRPRHCLILFATEELYSILSME